MPASLKAAECCLFSVYYCWPNVENVEQEARLQQKCCSGYSLLSCSIDGVRMTHFVSNDRCIMTLIR